MGGDALLGEIIEATGLPEQAIDDELSRLIARAGLQRSEITLDDLRLILADYIQDVLLAAKEEAAADDAKPTGT